MLHGRPEKDWAQSAVFYQIYPMGFCGAPFENDGVAVNRIQKVKEWIPHLEKLGVGAIYFSPVFESDTHGYDTRDYRKIDCRLGTNEDFKEVCEALHAAGHPGGAGRRVQPCGPGLLGLPGRAGEEAGQLPL